MNNAGTVLLTLADMSVIQAEVEVDETNIPQRAARADGEDHDRRDSGPDVQGPRHRDRQQPDPGDRHAATRDTQATNFKVVVVLDEEVPDVRPGFTCTADITTATRASGRRGADSGRRRSRARLRRERPDREGATHGQTPPGADRRAAGSGGGAQARPDAQGNRRACSSLRSGRAEFVPIKMGIAGDKYFEVLVGTQGRRPGRSPARTTRSAAWPTATR